MEIRERISDYKKYYIKVTKDKRGTKGKGAKIRLISWEKKEKTIRTIEYTRRKESIKKTKKQFIVNVKKLKRRNQRKENK